MGTLIRLTVYSKREPSEAMVAARKRFEELDARLSDYKPDSEINQLKTGVTTRVSPDLFAVLTFSKRLSLVSGGAFDVTIGARTRGRSGNAGYQHMALGNQTVTLLQEQMQLDLGGIAKGYANDQASRVLSERGFSRHLIAASGDVLVNESPPGEAGWVVSYQEKAHVMRRQAVSTSGNTFQPNHILDPRTMTAVTVEGTVSVVARNSMSADALATACLILNLEERGQLLSHYAGAKLVSA